MSDRNIPYPLDPESVLERYRHALGEFIHDFAWLEVCLFRMLCAVAGVSVEVGQALFSGTRGEAMMQLIKRCYVARGNEIEPYLKRAFDQAGVLNGVRNNVVHFVTMAVEDSEDVVLATSQFRYMERDAKDLLFTPDALYALAKDARIISAMLTMAEAEALEPGSTGQIAEMMRTLRRPWHYKAPSQPRRKR